MLRQNASKSSRHLGVVLKEWISITAVFAWNCSAVRIADALLRRSW
jgi:hypothetical protein